MIQLLTSNPHTEEDIIANQPIKWKINEILMEFPLMAYSAYIKFRKAAKLLQIEAFLAADKLLPKEIVDELVEIRLDAPSMKWWDLFGLPWIIIKYATIIDRTKAFDEITLWYIQNPTLMPFEWPKSLETCTDIQFRLGLTAYLAAHNTPIEMVEVLNLLLELQYRIKKKLAILLAPKTETSQSSVLPLSPSTRALWESRQRKLSRMSATSSS